MARIIVLCVLLFVSPACESRTLIQGVKCAACTLVVGLTTQLAEIREQSLYSTALQLCGLLPELYRLECGNVVDDLQNYIELSIINKYSPDEICYNFGPCEVQTEQKCHLFPLLQEGVVFMKPLSKAQHSIKIDVCELPVVKDICDVFINIFDSLEAAEDIDKDGFSIIRTVRGSNWRGRDCNDLDSDVYPGRKPLHMDINYDSNCNGIWGINNLTSISWEDELCSSSKSKGIIYIGDSIGAHFHMPEMWINPMQFTFENVFNTKTIVLNEIDWPFLSFSTGFMNTSQPNLIKGYTDSLYLRLLKRNRCNHRDYQNLSKNGANSSDSLRFAKSLSRNNVSDYPAVVFYGMVGNDVCNRYQNTLEHMTKPKVFEKNVLETLTYLNGVLPKDSHVVLLELVDGHFLYPNMAKRIHPLGAFRKNIRYKDFYNWLNCLEICPCSGWMNVNTTLRKLTSRRSRELSVILKKIAGTYNYEQFSLHFLRNPINKIVEEKNIEIWKFVDPVDSLHPNQKAQSLLAEVLWKDLLDLPFNIFGEENANNDRIKQIFRDQGGH